MVSFTYNSQLNDKPFQELLADNFSRDLVLQRTETGIHKDDIDFYINPKSPEGDLQVQNLKGLAHRGSKKALSSPSNLRSTDFIRQSKNFNPLLLIDDIFDKLDNDRSQKLVELIAPITSARFF